MEEEKAHSLIQSYVMRKFFVSTAYRQSSAAVSSPPWYYETIIWDWDDRKSSRGEMKAVMDSGRTPKVALKSHFGICFNLVTKKEKSE